MIIVILLTLFTTISCSSSDQTNFRKEEYLSVTKSYSYRLTSVEVLKDLVVGGVENPAIECELGEFEKAQTLLRKLYNTHNQKPNYWLQAAVCAHTQNKIELSHYLFEQAKKTSLNKEKVVDPNVLINFAFFYHGIQNYGEAYDYYKKAINVAGENLLLKLNYTRLLLKIGFFDSALEIAHTLYQSSSFDSEVLHVFGTSLLMKGNYALSIKTYKQIRSSDLKRRDIAINYALALFMTGERSAAYKILQNSDPTQHKALEKRFAEVLERIKT